MNIDLEAIQGLYVYEGWARYREEEIPGVRQAREVHERYWGFKDPENNDYLYGWLNSIIIGEALKIALEKVGYENINGEAIMEAMESIQDFDTGGISGILSYSKTERRGTRAWRLYQVEGDRMICQGGWREVPDVFGMELSMKPS